MSEKTKLYEKHKEEVKKLQEHCKHEKTTPYNNHIIESSSYCLICGKVFNIVYRDKNRKMEWDSIE